MNKEGGGARGVVSVLLFPPSAKFPLCMTNKNVKEMDRKKVGRE
jgi:hypothetical protein